MSVTEHDEEGCPACGIPLEWHKCCLQCGECYDPSP